MLTFEEAERRYRELRSDYKSRQITARQFKDAVKTLRLEDSAGKWWQVDIKTGGWLLWDGESWVPDDPSRVTRRFSRVPGDDDQPSPPAASSPRPRRSPLEIDSASGHAHVVSCQSAFAGFRACLQGDVPGPREAWSTLEAVARALAAVPFRRDETNRDDEIQARRSDAGPDGSTVEVAWTASDAAREKFELELDGAGALVMASQLIGGTVAGRSHTMVTPFEDGWEVRFPLQGGMRVAVSGDGAAAEIEPAKGLAQPAICRKCGARLRRGKRFCWRCGASPSG